MAARGARAYAAAVEYADARAGRVFREVDFERTTLLFTADHGVYLGEFGLWEKAGLHEHVTRVPLIVAGVAVEPGAPRVGAPVELLDLFPTILGIAGVDVPPGRSKRRLPRVRSFKLRKAGGRAAWHPADAPDGRRVASSWKFATGQTGLSTATASATHVVSYKRDNETVYLHEALYLDGDAATNVAAPCGAAAPPSVLAAARKASCAAAAGPRPGVGAEVVDYFRSTLCSARWGV